MSPLLKKLILGLVVTAVLIFVAKQWILTEEAPHTTVQESGYKFYYYPKLNMYYDASQNNFVYSVDGGHTWLNRKPANDQVAENISDKVIFYSPEPDTWTKNAEHRSRYNGILTSYIDRPEDTATVSIDTTSRLKKKAPVTKVEEKKEEEQKRGFFKKLREKIKKGFRKKEENKEASAGKEI
jgi:hypothetical protein